MMSFEIRSKKPLKIASKHCGDAESKGTKSSKNIVFINSNEQDMPCSTVDPREQRNIAYETLYLRRPKARKAHAM